MSGIFNPFGKEFKEVKEADLELLKTVSEGWHLEYKKEKLNGKSIAKSISSFANSYGGLYFIGIEANTSNNCAEQIIGVDDSPDIIRDSVRGNLQPFPYFETFSIPLTNGKKVLMAVIDSGENPPYINSDGKIYRRQEAASDPVFEKDRYSIDKLYEKAGEYMREIEHFREFDLTFCNGEEEVSYLEIFVNTVPFNHFFVENFFDPNKLSELLKQFNSNYAAEKMMNQSKITFVGIMRFDSLNTYQDSVSFRSLDGANLAYNGTTLELDVHGNIRMLIALYSESYREKTLRTRYRAVLDRSRDWAPSIRFLDARMVISPIFCLFLKYAEYLGQTGYGGDIEVKMRLKNCHRRTLYFESEDFLAHVEKCGIPICMKSDQYFPHNPILLNLKKFNEQPVDSCLTIFSHAATALGVPAEVALTSIFHDIRDPIEKLETVSLVKKTE